MHDTQLKGIKEKKCFSLKTFWKSVVVMHLEDGIPSICLKIVIILQSCVIIYMKHCIF